MLYYHASSSCPQLFSNTEDNLLPFGIKLDQEASQKHLYAMLYEYTDNYLGLPVAGNMHEN
jgi:hypothetical protein